MRELGEVKWTSCYVIFALSGENQVKLRGGGSLNGLVFHSQYGWCEGELGNKTEV